MEQLRNLLAIREVRVGRLRAELAQRLSALSVLDEELETVADELSQIARQRAAWERDWQQWLQQDRVLRHGQEYNLSHVALSAWQQDAAEAHREISCRRERAAADADEARRRLIKAEQRLRLLQERLHAFQREQRIRRSALADSRFQDEAAARSAARLVSQM